MGLWVNGSTGHANGHTPRGLLGVDLHKVKRPKQMLWAAAHRLKVFLVEEEPEVLLNVQARPKGLAEVTSHGQQSHVVAGEPIHNVPDGGHEIGDGVCVVGVVSALDVIEGDVVLYQWGHCCCGGMILGFMRMFCGVCVVPCYLERSSRSLLLWTVHIIQGDVTDEANLSQHPVQCQCRGPRGAM